MLHETASEPVVYEFTETPDPGETQSVSPGVTWLRMPLPFALSHINLWLLDDDDGCVIVDTGVCDDDSQAVWRRIVTHALPGGRVSRVLVTHLHPDHSGCAGWLCDTLGVPLWMTREEYLLCRVLTADTGRQAPSTGVSFYHAAGFPEHALNRYEQMFGMFGRFVAELPESYTRLQDGQSLSIGPQNWEVIIGRGHSPEHACLFDADRNILISGDQLLPTISSNVSVYPTEPAADPLKEWLSSLRKLKRSVPGDVLVLPSHGRPFRGAHHRLDALIAEHESSLDALLDRCREPQRAVDVFPALFRAPVRDTDLVMATGESLAHLNYLVYQGEIERTRDERGVDWYAVAN
ncbi:MAG: MBL fold metallo-hydrolase [Pseudomonadota bacterium]